MTPSPKDREALRHAEEEMDYWTAKLLNTAYPCAKEYVGHYERLLHLARERVEQLERGEWQPIATAPKDEYVLVYHPDVGMRVGFLERSEWFGFGKRSPTHWQPLPAPPTVQEKGETDATR